MEKADRRKMGGAATGTAPQDARSEGPHNNRQLAYLMGYSTGRFATKLYLLLTPELVKEFHLNDDAAEELLDLPTVLTKHNENLYAAIKKDKEAKKSLQTLEDHMVEEAVRRVRTDVLRPEQSKTLDSWNGNARACSCFKSRRCSERLQLTPEQANALPETCTKAFQGQRPLPFSTEYATCTAKGNASVVTLFDAEQKKTWVELYGEPFDLTKVKEFEPFRFIWVSKHMRCCAFVGPVDTWMTEAWIRRDKKDYAAVLSAFDEMIRLTPKDAEVIQKKAYFLATCPDAKIRDGRKAVELAKRALELGSDEYVISVRLWDVGCAYAEVGDFDRAVQYMSEALKKQHTTENNDNYQRKLKLFLAKQPYHEGPAK